MLPQFGFTELLLIAVVALIVVGPEDLPKMMRKLGQFLARGRAMASEFRAAFDDIAKQAELDELRKEIEALKRDNQMTAAVEELKSVEQEINASVMRAHADVEPAPVQDAGDPDLVSDPAPDLAPDLAPEAAPRKERGS